MKNIFRILVVFLSGFITNALYAQSGITGTVTNADGPVKGASISTSPGGKGTTTDASGIFKLNLNPGTYKVTISNTGYVSNTQTVNVSANEMKTVDAVLAENKESLVDVVVVGTRSLPRSLANSPLPVDNVDSKALKSTGQLTFDKALQYRVPSFNTVQTPVNDATSLLDPYEIRNMGPSRTLILINGKRKNMSSLVYTQTSPGRGETGADISAIPTDAIERVEILRDGASAQYGSDAIAGVMNIILKKNTNGGSATLRTGITGKGDGKIDRKSVV